MRKIVAHLVRKVYLGNLELTGTSNGYIANELIYLYCTYCTFFRLPGVAGPAGAAGLPGNYPPIPLSPDGKCVPCPFGPPGPKGPLGPAGVAVNLRCIKTMCRSITVFYQGRKRTSW